jgi:predicted RNA-binding protein with RPS1 domain
VSSLKADEAKKYRLTAGGGEIPTLRQVLELADGRVPLLIELKGRDRGNRADALWNVLKDYNGVYAVQSFNPVYLMKLRRKVKDIPLGFLTKRSSRGMSGALFAFLSRNLLFNFLFRPDFISYKYDEKLTLSVKDVLMEQEKQERNSRIARLVVGTVVTGTVEQIMPYGAFVSIGEDLSGLLHISQICAKRIKTPTEVIKVGDTVNVKIIDVKDGKVSLSMKAVEEDAEVSEEVEEVAPEYYVFEDKSANTTMASLFANIKL